MPVDEDEQTIMNNLQQDPVFAKNSNLQIKKVVLAYNLEDYLKVFNEVSKKKTLVKKMQFKENKERKTMTVLPDFQDLKENINSLSVDNLERSSSKFSKPNKQVSFELSLTMRKKARGDPSPLLKEELEKLKELNIHVISPHQVRCSKEFNER